MAVHPRREEYNAIIKDWYYEDYPGQNINGPEDMPPSFKDWLQQEKETEEFFAEMHNVEHPMHEDFGIC